LKAREIVRWKRQTLEAGFAVFFECSTRVPEYSAHLKNGKYIFLDCSHYLHAYESQKIADEARAFLEQL